MSSSVQSVPCSCKKNWKTEADIKWDVRYVVNLHSHRHPLLFCSLNVAFMKFYKFEFSNYVPFIFIFCHFFFLYGMNPHSLPSPPCVCPLFPIIIFSAQGLVARNNLYSRHVNSRGLGLLMAEQLKLPGNAPYEWTTSELILCVCMFGLELVWSKEYSIS